jgi:Flp pilus assembly protein CpaB
MRPNRKIRIGVAIIAAAFLLWGFVALISSLRRSTSAPTTNVAEIQNTPIEPVSAPARDRIAFIRNDYNPGDAVTGIPARSILTADMLEYRDSNGGDTGPYVTNIEAGALGYITNRPLNFGERLRKADLVGHISEVGVAGALLPGRRAMVIPLQGKNTLHDLVRIGDRVDIMASFDAVESRTVVQDVRVLAVDVFGKDYPQVKVAMRGDYKATPRDVGVAVPPSPTGGQGQSGNPDSPQTGAPGAAGATPTPTPTAEAPTTRPDPAITIEVTPEQATAISLTQASGQNIDFLIRPRTEPALAPGAGGIDGEGTAAGEATVQVASITRPRLAPYATRVKQTGGNTGGNANRAASAPAPARAARPTRQDSFRDYTPSVSVENRVPVLPPPSTQIVPPASVTTTPRVETYDIPVYADGKMVRMDTVRRPQD